MKGFSLIELMVVIAIVAVLAAIAVPAYSQYTAKAKVAKFITIIDSLSTQAKEYFDKNGAFPSAADLGFQTVLGDPATVSDPSAIDPDLESLGINDSALNIVSCPGNETLIWANNGFMTQVNDYYYLYINVYYKLSSDDVFESFCFEQRSPDMVAWDPDPNFSGYFNCTYPNGGQPVTSNAEFATYLLNCAQP